jgi:hypothetical protein
VAGKPPYRGQPSVAISQCRRGRALASPGPGGTRSARRRPGSVVACREVVPAGPTCARIFRSTHLSLTALTCCRVDRRSLAISQVLIGHAVLAAANRFADRNVVCCLSSRAAGWPASGKAPIKLAGYIIPICRRTFGQHQLISDRLAQSASRQLELILFPHDVLKKPFISSRSRLRRPRRFRCALPSRSMTKRYGKTVCQSAHHAPGGPEHGPTLQKARNRAAAIRCRVRSGVDGSTSRRTIRQNHRWRTLRRLTNCFA